MLNQQTEIICQKTATLGESWQILESNQGLKLKFDLITGEDHCWVMLPEN